MATSKIKWDPKDIKGGLPPRRSSSAGLGQEDSATKEILREIQKISEKQDDLQKNFSRMEAKQDQQQKMMQEELKNMRIEVGTFKEEMKQMKEDIKETKEEKVKGAESQKKLEKKVQKLDIKIQKTEDAQERLEMKEMEFQLRFRNLKEETNETNEDIRGIIVSLTAEALKMEEEDMGAEIDRVYRISTNYSRQNKTARDTIVFFGKKRIRDELLRRISDTPIQYKGNKVIIMKEFPQSMLLKRRKYFFLTDELKKLHIRFRWEKPEGIMVTYKEQRHWLTSEEKAKQFLEVLKKDHKVSPPLRGGTQKKRKFGSPEDLLEAGKSASASGGGGNIPEKDNEDNIDESETELSEENE